jgi:hypothetical protein
LPKKGKGYVFMYMASGPVNINEGFHAGKQSSQLVSSINARTPPTPPDGTGIIGILCTIAGILTTVKINQDTQEAQKEIERLKPEFEKPIEGQKSNI